MEVNYIEYYNQENWLLAKKELQKHLKKNPDSHYELALLASIYRIEKKYKKSYDIIVKALEINRYCPRVLWHFADICSVTGKDEWAEITWKYIIKQGVKRLSTSGGCQTDISDAASIINDSRYRLSLLLKKSHPASANRYFSLYKKKLGEGVESIYG